MRFMEIWNQGNQIGWDNVLVNGKKEFTGTGLEFIRANFEIIEEKKESTNINLIIDLAYGTKNKSIVMKQLEEEKDLLNRKHQVLDKVHGAICDLGVLDKKEEKKTLSDKIYTTGESNQALSEDDVKQANQEFIDWLTEPKGIPFSELGERSLEACNREVIKKAEEIYGEKLL